MRLLFAGKFLEDEKVLQDVPHVSTTDTTTFHIIVMSPPANAKAAGSSLEKAMSGGGGADGASRQGAGGRCQCVVS